jgi:hypothetical protein
LSTGCPFHLCCLCSRAFPRAPPVNTQRAWRHFLTGKSDAAGRGVGRGRGRGRTLTSSVASAVSAAPLKRPGLAPHSRGGFVAGAAPHHSAVPLTSSSSLSAITIDCDPVCIVLDDDDDDQHVSGDLRADGQDADVADDEFEIIERGPLSVPSLLTFSSSSATSTMSLLSTSSSSSTASSAISPNPIVACHGAVRGPERASTTNAFEVMARAAAAASSRYDYL